MKIITLLIYLECIESYKGSCFTCSWMRYRYPKTNECGYYNKVYIDVIENCTKYNISYKDIDKGL